MRKCPAKAGAAFFSDSSLLNGPAPGSSYGGACAVPPKLGDSSAAAELIMATVAVKEAIAHRIQAAELRQGPWGATPLYLDALMDAMYGADGTRRFGPGVSLCGDPRWG